MGVDPLVSRTAGEVPTHGAEVVTRGYLLAVLGAHARDGQAVVAAVAGVGSGDDHHAVALAVEDAAGRAAVAAFGHDRRQDLEALALVVGEGARIRSGLGAHETFEVCG